MCCVLQLTLECVLLSSAVLFIFCGLTPTACALLVPAIAIAFVAAAVTVAHRSLAATHAQVTHLHRFKIGFEPFIF